MIHWLGELNEQGFTQKKGASSPCGPLASNTAFVPVLTPLPLIMHGLCKGFLWREGMKALPDVVYPHENKEQGLMVVTRTVECNLHSFLLDWPASKWYQPSAPTPAWLSNADWWLCLCVPKSRKRSQEQLHWRGKDKVTQRSPIARRGWKHPPKIKRQK